MSHTSKIMTWYFKKMFICCKKCLWNWNKMLRTFRKMYITFKKISTKKSVCDIFQKCLYNVQKKLRSSKDVYYHSNFLKCIRKIYPKHVYAITVKHAFEKYIQNMFLQKWLNMHLKMLNVYNLFYMYMKMYKSINVLEK